MSVNDTPALRAMFAGFEIEPVATTYTIARGEGDVGARELIISDAGPTGAAPGEQMELV